MSNYISNGNIDIALCDDAIGWLKAIKMHYIHGGDETYDACRKRAIDVGCEALELLKEQSRKQVLSFGDGYAEGYKAKDQEIVRCKDCIHYDRDENCKLGTCLENGVCSTPDWFCADGTPKDGGTT